MGRKPPIVFRLDNRIRRQSIVGILLLMVAPELSVEPPSAGDQLREAKRLVWLNNWSEAARVLDGFKSYGLNAATKADVLFARAVHIRGNIESMTLPAAANEVASMLESREARMDSELRLDLLSIKGDIEFQYNLPASQKTWEEASRTASEAGKSLWKSRAEGELGTIAFLNGEVFKATKLVTGAVLKAEIGGDVAAQIRYRTALGEGFAEYGRTADAIRFFDKALALSAATPGAYFPFTASLGKARLLVKSGHSGDGLRILHHELDESRKNNLKVREARTLTVLGELAADIGNRQQAMETLTEAADVAQGAGLDRIEADATSALASLLRDMGKPGSAETYARRSVNAAEKAGDLYHLPQLTAVLADIEESNGHLVRADAEYSRATNLVNELLNGFPHPRNKNILVATMGRVFQGHFDLALNKTKDPGRAFQILESARAYGLVDVLREPRNIQHHMSVLDSTLAPKIAAVNRELTSEPDPGQRSRLLDRLWELEVRALHPSELGTSSKPEPVSLRQLQSALSPGELVIEYALQSRHSLALAITRDRIDHYDLKGRDEIEAAIDTHLAAVRARRDSRAEAKALYHLLLEPVVLLNDSNRVVIIPEGKLHLVPFDALVGPDNRYVLETHVISFAPSATVYCLLSPRMPPRRGQMTLLAVGGARYPFRGNITAALRGLRFFDPSSPPRWSAIPQSLTEVTELDDLRFGKTLMLTGDDANEGALKRLPLATFRVLHFAVHAMVDEEFPDRSGLVLSSRMNDMEDDILQAREIVGFDLNAELVTLSACDVGAGKIEGIAGMNSLVQAFLMAGARSVVATIWAADDTFTAALMHRFYANLRGGSDKAEALTLAKRDLVRMNGPNALPFYWAGFRLIGDTHKLISETEK
jgi:CHAT domain-containing protein